MKKSAPRKKLALGRGLGALIPEIDETLENDVKDYFPCDIELIHPNRYQPRRSFDEADLAELTLSIREQGIIQPLIVRKDTSGYELVAGERRLRAAKRVGLERVPVVVKELTDAEMLEISVVENIQRADLNPLEEADAYHRLITEFNLTQDQAAERVGKSRSAVANMLRLRQLPDPIKADIMAGKLSMGHARALLGADTGVRQMGAWRTVVSKGLSVRETEALIKRLNREPKKPEEGAGNDRGRDNHLSDLSAELSRRFGTKVQIKRFGKKGRVEIEFYHDDDLNRLLDLLNKR